MALSLSRFTPSPLRIPSTSSSSSSRIKPTIINYRTTPIFSTTTTKNHRISSVLVKSTDKQDQPPPQQQSDEEQQQQTQLGTEIKKAMMETKDLNNNNEDNGFWGGVADEIGKIEWPAFNKVVGTTGVVLGVIAGSSVVLLTVNAVLAELSDRVFVGRGVQDFFG